MLFWLRFLSDRAIAREFPASGASAAVFFLEGFAEVDFGDVGDRCKPSDNVGKFFLEVFAIVSGAKSRGQLTDFLHEPHKCTRNSAFFILVEVHRSDEVLEIAEGDIGLCVVWIRHGNGWTERVAVVRVKAGN